jgi:hypothetical protein
MKKYLEEFCLVGYNTRSLLKVNRRFGGTWLHLQRQEIIRAINHVATRALLEFQWTTGRCNPKHKTVRTSNPRRKIQFHEVFFNWMLY